MKLLKRRKLIKTGPVDYADWNYHPFLGPIQRLRFSLALSLLPIQSGRLLEVGYGSGVLMPALKDKCEELYGIDIHLYASLVESSLASEGVTAHLSHAQAEDLPFENDFFDTIVAISSMEFVSDLHKSCQEIRRVLKPKGKLIIVTPGHSSVVDFGLRLLTGNDARKDFGNRREALIPTLAKYFALEVRKILPPIGGGIATLYKALRYEKVVDIEISSLKRVDICIAGDHASRLGESVAAECDRVSA